MWRIKSEFEFKNYIKYGQITKRTFKVQNKNHKVSLLLQTQSLAGANSRKHIGKEQAKTEEDWTIYTHVVIREVETGGINKQGDRGQDYQVKH